ncbi:hypothetical protein GCM10027361_23720 [Erwinia aphidicola]|jgi:hypothetical protein|nr:hypothetical protein BOM23_00010 [Erwinia sp. OLMDLW33]CAH0229605.1 hypothetical protein SRABI13_02426 [Erwinia aphidicola]
MKLIPLALLALCLNGCADSAAPLDSRQGPVICQGFGCNTPPGKHSSSSATHKPTRDEKIRARQGLPPDFGSDESRVSFPIKF